MSPMQRNKKKKKKTKWFLSHSNYKINSSSLSQNPNAPIVFTGLERRSDLANSSRPPQKQPNDNIILSLGSGLHNRSGVLLQPAWRQPYRHRRKDHLRLILTAHTLLFLCAAFQRINRITRVCSFLFLSRNSNKKFCLSLSLSYVCVRSGTSTSQAGN